MTFAQILEKNVSNWHKRIFLESLHSTKDKNAVNERKPFPSVYKTLTKLKTGTMILLNDKLTLKTAYLSLKKAAVATEN